MRRDERDHQIENDYYEPWNVNIPQNTPWEAEKEAFFSPHFASGRHRSNHRRRENSRAAVTDSE